MDWYPALQGLILGIVEGLTEFLPISSTGHLILAGQMLGFNDERGKLFEVVIQSGAILAICWEYRQRLLHFSGNFFLSGRERNLALNLLIAFIPVAVTGVLFLGYIKTYLFYAEPVSVAFIVGGLLILWVERRQIPVKAGELDDIRWQDAWKVGLVQCLSLIPGTSRSGATIIGGLYFGWSRKASTEFSFFLAIPVLLAASAYDLFKYRHLLRWEDLGLWGTGFLASFLSTFICVRWLLRFIAQHSFALFAWYRIVFGVVILMVTHMGWITWPVAS